MKGEKEVNDFVDVPKEICAQAVLDWYNMGMQENYESKFQNSEVREKARRHLSAMGWSFWRKDKGGKLELRYYSPNGKTFISLRTACKHCIDEGGVSESVDSSSFSDYDNDQASTSNPNVINKETNFSAVADHEIRLASGEEKENSETSRMESRKRSVYQCSSSTSQTNKLRKIRKKDGEVHQPQEAYLRHKEVENHASSSSLRKRKALKDVKKMRDNSKPELPAARSSEKRIVLHKPATVLSSLVDNNVVLPMAKVHYRSRKPNAPPLATGKITRDGIVCNCCSGVYGLSAFERHAGSTNHRPAANIILEDGRSLQECNLQLKNNKEINMVKDQKHSDDICSVCHYTGELVICDRCPSTFHLNCVGLSEVPVDEWICPSCCCGVCGHGDSREATDEHRLLICNQCELKYHTDCVKNNARVINLEGKCRGNWFCSRECENIHLGLRKIIGKPIPVGNGNLTWTLLKFKDSNDEALAENYSKLNAALSVMHECFEPVKDPYSHKDVVEEVMFNGQSELRRLNFRGFYTVVLEKGGKEVITVATVRINGERVAEVPLVGTKFKYRRLGMCRVLMDELENQLSVLGVERLTLPAIPSAVQTWTDSFGFSKMTGVERSQFLKYTFLDFPDTAMCQKLLKKSSPSIQICSSAISLITQAEQQSRRIRNSRPIHRGVSAIPECSVEEANHKQYGYFQIPKQIKIPASTT
ncbi:hypothetical protein FNV43_RR11731 [Rhamnella rubrinervis]|uniref:PHD-type domain-containing protein n=1 Tax=Rhamnella rubrinervis TaxID=2594499 RepID=A0A8K0H628_9ROSA|nr:hypothetical protein FNV43_RR11731 [Rhamnella rubrinervis]